jgi:hypothetical protein
MNAAELEPVFGSDSHPGAAPAIAARRAKAETRELFRIAAQSALANGGKHLDAKDRALARRRAAVKPLGRALGTGDPL